MYLTNFIFTRTFFLIAFYQIFKNYAILINHESFKNSLQLELSQLLKIDSLMVGAIKASRTSVGKSTFCMQNDTRKVNFRCMAD